MSVMKYMDFIISFYSLMVFYYFLCFFVLFLEFFDNSTVSSIINTHFIEFFGKKSHSSLVLKKDRNNRFLRFVLYV